MSGDEEANNEDVIPSNITNPRDASRYALQLALQTMKERCQHFQNRLAAVEEENLQLHLERLHCNIRESKSDTSRLEEQVAQLTRQKTQLTHHIFMVATENKQLWTRLSRLTEANQSLGSHLTKISETLNSHAADVSKPSQSINIINSCDKQSKELKDESLEEISLKIINNIMREKKDLEQQYDQMVELHTNTVSMEDCEFTLNTNDLEVEDVSAVAGETEDLLQDMKRVADKLKEEKEALQKQQAGLKVAVNVLTDITKNGLPCPNCQKLKDIPNSCAMAYKSDFLIYNSTTNNIDQQLRSIAEPPSDPADIAYNTQLDDNSLFLCNVDRMCPICGRFYLRNTKFEEFNEHVLTHFPK